MKRIDRALFAAILYLALYGLYMRQASQLPSAALAFFTSASIIWSVGQIVRPIEAKRHKSRIALEKARNYVRALALMPKDEAERAIVQLLTAEGYAPKRQDRGFLCAQEDRSIWVALCLRHPESNPLSTQEIAEALIGQKAHKAKQCCLITLCPVGKVPADRELASVRIIDPAALAGYFAKHPQLLPESSGAPTAHRRDILRSFLVPPRGRKIARHFGYALLLVPSFLFSKSPIVFLCMLAQTGLAFYGLIALRKKPGKERILT